jgi:hypothetical protein
MTKTPSSVPPATAVRSALTFEEESRWAWIVFGLAWALVNVVATGGETKLAAAIAALNGVRNGVTEVLREDPYVRYASVPKPEWEGLARGSKIRARMWALGAAVFTLAALIGGKGAGPIATALLLTSIGVALLAVARDARRRPHGLPADSWYAEPRVLQQSAGLCFIWAFDVILWSFVLA